MYAAKNSILGERKFRLMNQRDMEKLSEDYHTEKYLRHQQVHETLDLLALFEKPDTAKLVREVAIALMGGRSVSIPCADGGSVSSEWLGRSQERRGERGLPTPLLASCSKDRQGFAICTNKEERVWQIICCL